MEIPIKYMASILIIMAVVYGVSAFLYVDSETPEMLRTQHEEIETGNPLIDEMANRRTTDIWDILGSTFEILTFQIPHMPSQVTIVLNIIFIPMMLVFLYGLYPIIRDVLQLATKFLDAIIPF